MPADLPHEPATDATTAEPERNPVHDWLTAHGYTPRQPYTGGPIPPTAPPNNGPIASRQGPYIGGPL